MTWPSARNLIAETAALAQAYHWSLDSILDLNHRDRRAYLREASVLRSAS